MNRLHTLLVMAVLLSCPLVSQAQWSAFNDQWKGPNSHRNATFYTTPGLYTGADNAGPLSNILTGAELPVSVLITNYGQVNQAGLMSGPLPGTAAANIFGGYIDWQNGGNNNGIHIYPTNVIGIVFDGLDLTKTYKFIATSVRGGNSSYSNRWTRAQLVGAVSYVPAHTENVLTSAQFPGDLTGNEVAFMSGINSSGDVVEWNSIVPQPGTNGGTFTVLCGKYNGHFVVGEPGITANSAYSYAFSAFKLVEESPNLAITLLGPTNGARFAGDAVVTLTAEASQATNVAFYLDDLWLGNRMEPPASLTISHLAAGPHRVYALAQDAAGNVAYSATNTITISNLPLSITLASPDEGQTVAYGATLALRANATGATNVAFYLDGAFLANAVAWPYTANAANLGLGEHTFYAVASDESGYILFSATNTFTVATLSIYLLSPWNGEVFVSCTSIRMTNLLSGAPSNVVFFLDDAPIGNRTAPPWSVALPTPVPGWHSVYALAEDAGGTSRMTATNYFFQNANVSPAVGISNTFSAWLTNAPGRAYLAGACITNQLVVDDPDGSVTNLDWYVNGRLRVRIPPTNNQNVILLNDALAGTNLLQAVAWDNCGAVWTSAPVVVVVTNPPATILVSNGSSWSYYAAPVAPSLDMSGDPWRHPNYDDSTWPVGFGEFGVGDANRGTQANNPETTLLPMNGSLLFRSYYFRRPFYVSNPARYTNLALRIMRDDGAVIYLNGVEWCRSGVYTNFIQHDSLTGYPASPDNGTVYYLTNLSPTALLAGTNVLAVQVLQSTNNSPDVSFDLMLWAYGDNEPEVSLGISSLGGNLIGLWWTNSQFRPCFSTDLNVPRANWLPVPGNEILGASTNAEDRVDMQLRCPTRVRFYNLRRP